MQFASTWARSAGGETIGSAKVNRGNRVSFEPVHAIGPHGFRAVILDSEGNRLALHSRSDA
jgi:hypothetical protein